MNFTRKFKRLFAIICILTWMHLDVYTVYAAASAISRTTATEYTDAADSSAGVSADTSEIFPSQGVTNII